MAGLCSSRSARRSGASRRSYASKWSIPTLAPGYSTTPSRMARVIISSAKPDNITAPLCRLEGRDAHAARPLGLKKFSCRGGLILGTTDKTGYEPLQAQLGLYLCPLNLADKTDKTDETD